MKYDFKLEELKSPAVKSEVKLVNLGSIIQEMDSLDFDPPYQRGKVWKKEYNQELIKSILDETPIGAVHFVNKFSEFDGPDRWVLDAKQRLLAIKAFKNGEMSLRIQMHEKIHEVNWKMARDPKSIWHFIYRRIWDYQIFKVTWDACSFEEQKKIFERVNNSVALNMWERIYGKHYNVKMLLKYIFENAFVDLDIINKSVAQDRRNTGLKLIHSLMYVCFGPAFNDVVTPRDLSAKSLLVSCEALDRHLNESNVNADSVFDEELIDKIGFTQQVEMIRTACKWFQNAAFYKNGVSRGKKFEAVFVQDVLMFFTKKLQDKILTNSYVEQNPEKIHQFVVNWLTFKNADSTDDQSLRRQAIKSRSTQKSGIEKRMGFMETIFNELNFDCSIKENKLTANQKTLAVLVSNPTCPISGVAMTNNNTVIDHVNAKAISSDTPAVATGDIANRRKSDQSLDTVEKTLNFMSNVLRPVIEA